MNIKIIDGYVTVDGKIKVSVSHKLFTNEGMDICLPKQVIPDRRPCDKCRQWHDPDLCCHQPVSTNPFVNIAELVQGLEDRSVRFATTGDVNRVVVRLLESLAKRFERLVDRPAGFSFRSLITELRAEMENWK